MVDISYEGNPDNTDFSVSLFYNREIVATKDFNYK